MSSQFKPSPLGLSSPRASPFRRPESPHGLNKSPSTIRTTTPTSSPLKRETPSATRDETPDRTPTSITKGDRSWLTTRDNTHLSPQTSPTRRPSSFRASVTSASTARPTPSPVPFHLPGPATAPPARAPVGPTAGGPDPLAHIPAPLLHTMRESFSVLDHGNTGVIRTADVSDMLEQLGLEHHPTALSAYFPPSSAATMNLATYLSLLAAPMRGSSEATELREALAAFDDDDSGQVDVAELREALLTTQPEAGARVLEPSEVDRVLAEFSGRRAFSRNRGFGKVGAEGKGEVFKYHDFVNAVSGGGNGAPDAQAGG